MERKEGEEFKKFVVSRTLSTNEKTPRASLMGGQRKNSSASLELPNFSLSNPSPPSTQPSPSPPSISSPIIKRAVVKSVPLGSKSRFPTTPPPLLDINNNNNNLTNNNSNNNTNNNFTNTLSPPSNAAVLGAQLSANLTRISLSPRVNKLTSKTLSMADELTGEKIDQIFDCLKKFYNANKQLIVIAKSFEKVAGELQTTKAEVFRSQLKYAKESLEQILESFTAEVKRAAQQNPKKPLDACRLLHGVVELCNNTVCTINILKSITVESDNENLFKQTLMGINTARDALSQVVEIVGKNKEELDGDSILPMLQGFMRHTKASLENMISKKSGQIISFTKCYELESASRSTIAAITKLINSFNGPISQQIISVAKVASSSISQMIATLNDISSLTTVLCIPDLRSNILVLTNTLKKEFINFMELTKRKLAAPSPSLSPALSPSSSPSPSPSSSPSPSLSSSPSFTSHLTSLAPINSADISGEQLPAVRVAVGREESYAVSELQLAFRVIRVCIRDTISVISRCTTVDLKDLSLDSSLCYRPNEENFARAEKATLIPDDIYPPPPPKEVQQSFDLPDDLVPDVENIWEEPTEEEGRVVLSEEGQIKCATLNYLIQRLTSSRFQDMNFMKTFITTYRSFTTPEILLKKLIDRFRVPDQFAQDRVPIQLRTCNVLRQWVDTQYNDFTEELLDQLRAFLSEVSASRDCEKYISPIRNSLDKKAKMKWRHTQNEVVNLSIESKVPLSPSTMIFMFDEEEIARQITLVDFQIYQSIGPEELLNQAWSKPKYRHRAKNVLTLVARSTDVTMWVATTILLQETLKGRIRALTKLINIAEHLRKLNNFNSVMSVIAGINLSSVYRLKFTRAGISPQSQEVFSSLLDLMDPAQSYANYRLNLKSANPPCIPFLGTYLTDITFIEDGNPDYIKGLINFRKREFVYNAIREIQQFQQIKYSFELVDSIALFLTELPYIKDEEACFQLSLLREPRGATIESIV